MWLNKESRERAVRYCAAMPQSIWIKLIDDANSFVWNIVCAGGDAAFLAEVMRKRMGCGGPTRENAVKYIAEMMTAKGRKILDGREDV